ncbi:MAG TPA: hypothetical protein VJU61_18460 [Polyangiaceae bacterium]|nr:hypothetical protein [Polyangiaceae bacterium]
MSEPFRAIFSLIHLAGFAGLAALWFSPRWQAVFERRCLGAATASDLAFVRVVVCVTLAIYTAADALPSYALLDTSFFSPRGYMAYLGQATLDWFFSSAARLWAVVLSVEALLVLGALGVWTRVTLPLAAVVYLLFAGLLRAPGKLFHEGYLAWYVLIVLAFLPAGDAASVDAWRRRRRAAADPAPPALPAPAYAWMVWACQAAAVVPYLQLAFSKLWTGGLFWFDGRSLRNYLLTDDLNLTAWQIDLALRWYQAPTLLFTLTGLFGLLVETLYPLVLVVPRLRFVLPLSIMLLHLGVWCTQDALFVDAVLLPAIFFVPSRWPWRARS